MSIAKANEVCVPFMCTGLALSLGHPDGGVGSLPDGIGTEIVTVRPNRRSCFDEYALEELPIF